MTSISDSQAAALQGRRVAVTGAASGIGAATAKRLQALGCRVACLDRNVAGARATADAKGIAIEVDVADETSVIRAFHEAGNAWGGLDALVTAAGIINTTPFFETTVAQFRQLFDINVIGSFLSVREGSKYMERGARICMVASISSYTGGGYVARGAYATSKGAVLTMMKSCARELGPAGDRGERGGARLHRHAVRRLRDERPRAPQGSGDRRRQGRDGRADRRMLRVARLTGRRLRPRLDPDRRRRNPDALSGASRTSRRR